jgi:N-acetyl-anhydromuramyl-L-alanine amidase AmpD
MALLKTVDYIFVHTAADPRLNGKADTTVADITRWHVARGWATIGYHYVVRRDGTVETGRPVTQQGSHVRGLNHRSIGICLSGNHDVAPMTAKQRAALLDLLKTLCRRYKLPASAVLGHKEVNTLVAAGKLDKIYATSKSCPGRYVDMRAIRQELAEMLKQEGGKQ